MQFAKIKNFVHLDLTHHKLSSLISQNAPLPKITVLNLTRGTKALRKRAHPNQLADIRRLIGGYQLLPSHFQIGRLLKIPLGI